MVSGVYSRSGHDEVRECRTCSSKFVVGETYFYCKKHSFVLQSKNWKSLTKDEQRLRLKYAWDHGYREWYSSHLDYFLKHTKEWRKTNPTRKYTQKKKETDRYNEGTLICADNAGLGWAEYDIEFLRINKERLTARELAMELGRSYSAIIAKAFKEKIPLMTEDKKHMRLVTGKARKTKMKGVAGG